MASRAALAAASAAVAEVVVGGLADVEDLATEAERHASQVVVEIHLHMLVANLTNHSGHRAVLRLHDKLGTHFHHFVQDTILHEDFLVQIQYVAFITLTITLFGSQVKAIMVARLLAHQVLLELGQHLMHTADEGKGIVFGGLLDETAVLVFLA